MVEHRRSPSPGGPMGVVRGPFADPSLCYVTPLGYPSTRPSGRNVEVGVPQRGSMHQPGVSAKRAILGYAVS